MLLKSAQLFWDANTNLITMMVIVCRAGIKSESEVSCLNFDGHLHFPFRNRYCTSYYCMLKSSQTKTEFMSVHGLMADAAMSKRQLVGEK